MEDINGISYQFLIASDVDRNGIGVELYEIVNDTKIFRAEIFRNDSLKLVQFIGTNSEMPLTVLERLKEVFDSEIPKEYDC